MPKRERPEGWPEGMALPVWVRVSPAGPKEPFALLGDGRYTFARMTMHVDPGDGTTIDVEVHVVSGEVVVRSVTIASDEGLPFSTLRHHKLRDYVELGLGQTTWGGQPGSHVEFSPQPIAAARGAVRAAVRRRRNTPELLAQVADVYRAAGGRAEGVKAVAEDMSYDERHARRLRNKAIELGLLEEGE